MFLAEMKTLSRPPGEYGRKAKTQRIDGGSHKRWSMLLNSIQREEPYPGLDMLGCLPGNRIGCPSG